MRTSIVKEENGKNRSSVMFIVNEIKKLIINRKLEVGDKLPNEFELSELFGKSRTSIREAVKILESFGVLEVKRGDGTYVSASADSGMFDALFFKIISKGTDLSQLIELRRILEEGIINLAVEHITDQSLERVTDAQKALEDAIELNEEIEELVNLDIQFHECLVDIAGNEILKNVYLNMLDIFTPYIHSTYIQQDKGKNYTVSQCHDLMIRALKEKDKNLAAYSVHRSLADWQKLNREHIEQA